MLSQIKDILEENKYRDNSNDNLGLGDETKTLYKAANAVAGGGGSIDKKTCL